MEDRDVIARIVTAALEDASQIRPPGQQIEVGASTLLAGDGGVLTSLETISLILAVEQQVNATFGTDLVVFDEQLIADPVGPFRSVDTLVDHLTGSVRDARRKTAP